MSFCIASSISSFFIFPSSSFSSSSTGINFPRRSSKRDIVSRSAAIEIREGRGCGPKGDYILLKADHLGADLIKTRLPGIRELAITFAGIDPITAPIPVVPTCHYLMGGIPTNYQWRIRRCLSRPFGCNV